MDGAYPLVLGPVRRRIRLVERVLERREGRRVIEARGCREVIHLRARLTFVLRDDRVVVRLGCVGEIADERRQARVNGGERRGAEGRDRSLRSAVQLHDDGAAAYDLPDILRGTLEAGRAAAINDLGYEASLP